MSGTTEDAIKQLQRCRDLAQAEAVENVLEDAGIDCVVNSTAPNFDLSSIGADKEPEILVSVRATEYKTAREALERDALLHPLPEDYYLRDFSDEDLAAILAAEEEWSPYDVAHSRKLYQERGGDLATFEQEKSRRLDQLRAGKPAPKLLVYISAFSTIFTAVMLHIGIVWVGILSLGFSFGLPASLIWMKESTPQGLFPTFDARARRLGKVLLLLAVLVHVAMFLKMLLTVLIRGDL